MGKILVLIIAALILEMLNPNFSKVFLQTNSQFHSPFPTPTPAITQAPLSSPSPIATPQATPTPQLTNLQKFSYPNSKLISSNSGTVILESTDSAAAITTWYKNQIKSTGMKATSFIETNTNGEIFNQLVGADGVEKIKVSISKTSGNQTARIELKLYV